MPVSQYTFKAPAYDYEVTYQEFQAIIRAYFQRPDFRFLDHIYDVQNDTYQGFEVGCTLDTYDQKEVLDWLYGRAKDPVYVTKLLDVLVAQDIISDGNYLVEICW